MGLTPQDKMMHNNCNTTRSQITMHNKETQRKGQNYLAALVLTVYFNVSAFLKINESSKWLNQNNQSARHLLTRSTLDSIHPNQSYHSRNTTECHTAHWTHLERQWSADCTQFNNSQMLSTTPLTSCSTAHATLWQHIHSNKGTFYPALLKFSFQNGADAVCCERLQE